MEALLKKWVVANVDPVTLVTSTKHRPKLKNVVTRGYKLESCYLILPRFMLSNLPVFLTDVPTAFSDLLNQLIISIVATAERLWGFYFNSFTGTQDGQQQGS